MASTGRATALSKDPRHAIRWFAAWAIAALVIAVWPRRADGAAEGTLKWSFETSDYFVDSPAIGADGTLYIGAGDGLYALHPDGTEKWFISINYWVNYSPAIGADGTLYIGGNADIHREGILYAISPDGTKKRAFDIGGLASPSAAIGADGTVYAGSTGGTLYAIQPDGANKWAFATGWDAYTPPAIGRDGTVYVGSGDGKLYAIQSDGTEKWSFETGSDVASAPAIGADGTVYVGSGDSRGYENKLYAIHPNGTEKWSFTTLLYVTSSIAIGADGTVYVGCGDYEGREGKLYAIHPDGTLKWSFETGGSVKYSAAIGADGTVYVSSSNYYSTKFSIGTLYAIHPDGTEKWSFEAGGSLSSSPTIGPDGTVYIGSGDGKLYAIHGSSGGLDTNAPWPMFRHDLQHTGRVGGGITPTPDPLACDILASGGSGAAGAFVAGDTQTVRVSVSGARDELVDVYIAVALPDDSLYCLDEHRDLRPEIVPLVRNWPASNLEQTDLLEITLSALTPRGEYAWYFVLCRADASVGVAENWLASDWAAWTMADEADVLPGGCDDDDCND